MADKIYITSGQLVNVALAAAVSKREPVDILHPYPTAVFEPHGRRDVKKYNFLEKGVSVGLSKSYYPDCVKMDGHNVLISAHNTDPNKAKETLELVIKKIGLKPIDVTTRLINTAEIMEQQCGIRFVMDN